MLVAGGQIMIKRNWLPVVQSVAMLMASIGSHARDEPAGFTAAPTVVAITQASSATTGSARELRVGVRSDAKPFSYSAATDADETVLADYRGYMVEVCRRVLRDMVEAGPYQGYHVRAVQVDAGDRFDLLHNGELDVLCGPDSITTSRLRHFNVSHPMFLSGMTYGYVDPRSGEFPSGAYCKNIVGVVRGTTAASSGLRRLANDNLLLRFDEPLEQYLARSPHRLSAFRQARRKILEANPDRTADQLWYLIDPEWREIQSAIAADIKTPECPEGFSELPVKSFENHDDGVDAFCNKEVLYYIGDYDIIQRKIEARSNCPVVMERFTSTREVYAAFFRMGFTGAKPDVRVDRADSPKGREDTMGHCADCQPDDTLLYAVFNHTLLSMMQPSVNILEYEFKQEFGDAEQSEDLRNFFDSYKIASED